MANKMLEKLGNTKSRTLLLFGVFLFIILIVVVYFSFRKPSPLKTEESRAPKIPQITSVPGNLTSEKYRELQEEDNRRRAEAAKKTGGSAVATIIGSRNKESEAGFGIQPLAANCKCPSEEKPSEVPTINVGTAAQLIDALEKNPGDALRLLRANPGLAKALCTQKPDLALKIMQTNKEAAKIILNECPALAKQLADLNPALLKQLLLENCDSAKKMAVSNPEVLKKQLLADPDFATKLEKTCPDAIKTLMKNDPDFADQMAAKYPDLVKDLMRNDPDFARIMAKQNPGFVKKFLLEDPDFARAMAANNPDMLKELMKNDPAFAATFAKKNPTLVKELMKNDPAFAALLAKQNPDLVKQLMLDDPEFAKIMARNNPEMVSQLMKDDSNFAKSLLDKNPGLDKVLANVPQKPISGMTDQQKLQAIEDARRKQQEEQAKRALQAQLNEKQQQQIATIITNMEAQSKAAFAAWNEISPQAYVEGEEGKDKDSGGGGGTGGPGGGGADGKDESQNIPLFRAGTIFFAVLDTAINTDEPGPIMATIVQGPFKGAKLLGDMQLAPTVGANSPEKVTLNFALLSSPDYPENIPVKAVAIDPDTARTAIASDVDHHYLLRYGTLFASAFMTGYATVITAAGTTQITNNVSGSTQTSIPTLSPRQTIFASLGEVGKKFGEATKSYFSTPNTITVDAGTGIGVLFLGDVSGGGKLGGGKGTK